MDETPTALHDQIDILDLAAVLMENWKLLVFVPLIVAAASFAGLSFIATPKYVSQAIVELNSADAELLKSPRVLDLPIQQTDWLAIYGNSMPIARNELSKALQIQKLTDTNLYQITLTSRSDNASQVLGQVLDRLVTQSAPSGTRKVELEEKLKLQQNGLSQLSASFSRLNKLLDETSPMAGDGQNGDPRLGALGESFVALVANIQKSSEAILVTKRALEGSVVKDDIIQPPIQELTPANSRIIWMPVFAAGVVMVLLFVWVYIGEIVKRAASGEKADAKLARIKNSFRVSSK